MKMAMEHESCELVEDGFIYSSLISREVSPNKAARRDRPVLLLYHRGIVHRTITTQRAPRIIS